VRRTRLIIAYRILNGERVENSLTGVPAKLLEKKDGEYGNNEKAHGLETASPEKSKPGQIKI